IRQDVEAARARGYSLNPGLIVANSWGIGVAICSPDGRPVGALSIAAIDSRMQEPRQRELAGHLFHEVRQVEEKLARMFASKGPLREPIAIRHQTRRTSL